MDVREERMQALDTEKNYKLLGIEHTGMKWKENTDISIQAASSCSQSVTPITPCGISENNKCAII